MGLVYEQYKGLIAKEQGLREIRRQIHSEEEFREWLLGHDNKGEIHSGTPPQTGEKEGAGWDHEGGLGRRRINFATPGEATPDKNIGGSQNDGEGWQKESAEERKKVGKERDFRDVTPNHRNNRGGPHENSEESQDHGMLGQDEKKAKTACRAEEIERQSANKDIGGQERERTEPRRMFKRGLLQGNNESRGGGRQRNRVTRTSGSTVPLP